MKRCLRVTSDSPLSEISADRDVPCLAAPAGPPAGWAVACLLLALWGAWPGAGAWAADGRTAQAAPAPGQVELTADHLAYLWKPGSVLARGHVVLRYKDMEIQADSLTYTPSSGAVEARGNVICRRAGVMYRTHQGSYNVRTGQIEAGEAMISVAPWTIRAHRSRRLAGNRFILHDAVLTTCILDAPLAHWRIEAKRASVIPDQRVEAHHVTFFFGDVPVMRVPYWARNAREVSGFNVVPGYTTLMGAFLLGSYTYRLTPELKSVTHLDYRTRRGIAFGQDVKWRQRGNRWYGMATAYYADDQHPIESDEDPDLELVERERYRFGLQHRQQYGARLYLLGKLNYLSDPDVLEDFFSREYRRSFQPENFVSLTYRGDRHTADVLVRKRLNDFYSTVDRMPEASLRFARQQLARTRLYYEGQTAGSWLTRSFSTLETNENDYLAFRLDSAHTVYRPAKHFGFLTLIPRTGCRLTYYSKTLATNETTGARTEESGAMRTLYELGLESSFKAFRAWPNARHRFGFGLRHIAQPYADYTFVPEPDLGQQDLYLFDAVDTLGKQNEVRLGMRNKLQTRRRGRVHDLVDLDTFATYRFDPPDDGEPLESIFVDAEVRLVDWLNVDFDAQYDVEAGMVSVFNTELDIRRSDRWEFATEFRYRDQDGVQSSLLAPRLRYALNRSRISEWSVDASLRYELQDARLEEHAYTVRRKMDCMVAALGVSQIPEYTTSDGTDRDGEIKVWVEVWLTAFPKVGFALGR